MKRFRFDLQAALDFASHQVELHEMEIYRLEAQRTELSGLRDQIQKTIFESGEALNRKTEIYPEELLLHERFVTAQRLRQVEVERLLALVRERISLERKQLLEESRRRETLDRLKSRDKDLYDREMERVLQREADDLYLARKGRHEPAGVRPAG